MTEFCPAREVVAHPLSTDGYISELDVPQACVECIGKALKDSRATVTHRDTYEQALAYVRERDGQELTAGELDTWGETALRMPGEGLARYALIERGFDIGFGIDTQSYENGTETSTTEVAFDCYVETTETV